MAQDLDQVATGEEVMRVAQGQALLGKERWATITSAM